MLFLREANLRPFPRGAASPVDAEGVPEAAHSGSVMGLKSEEGITSSLLLLSFAYGKILGTSQTKTVEPNLLGLEYLDHLGHFPAPPECPVGLICPLFTC